MKKIIVNGANGYVASHFINELLLQNYQVVALVRESGNCSSAERMKKALAETYYRQVADTKNLEVYNYSLLERNFGLSPEEQKTVFSGDFDFFHFAASLKYHASDKEEIFKININGLENSIHTFLKHSASSSRFFFVSTAYSCGKFTGVYKEQFYANADIQNFRNYYEQSKRFAENTLKKYIDESRLNGHVLRLSQVVGHNQSGVTPTEYGVFDFAKRIQGISAKYPHKTVRLRINPGSTQNLISIDSTVEYLMKILKEDQLPVIINLVGRENMKNKEIINSICNLLPIKIIQKKELETDKLNSLERIVAAGMAFTGVYANLDLKFDSKNLDKIVSANGNEVTAQSLHKMLDYFFHKSKRVKNKQEPTIKQN
ncbi:MAG: SDR family oxidoreductase [Prolixibacteraceae bacterium]